MGKRKTAFGRFKTKERMLEEKSFMKAMPSDAERTEADEIVAPKVKETQLLQIIKRQALNAEDRYTILDARDKLMKLRGMDRQGKVLMGTCPDMCPEKERYSRWAKNQLRIYEKLGEEINHKATLKEYSRSSADQDVPLPHELRPSPVLNLSMNHLLSNVIDRIENVGTSVKHWYESVEHHSSDQTFDPQPQPENLGLWFEFVWSVTRAIRKDITQQRLNDMTAVNLVEKCARLHIVCSARLIEEDASNFSSKLNDENLTKCLQTLKHMYEDLKHENIVCPNEPEFRSYEVLMNLNNGDIMRSILTLDTWVRSDVRFKFALKIFMALNNHDYVRFFKLVRATSVLQGCILMRYFYQIRNRALSVIIKSYCPNSKIIVNFSLTKLTSLLGFEDIQSCGFWCQMHGLSYEVNADTVSLSSDAFHIPDELPEPTRARNLIESKRTVPWSQEINGSILEPNPYLTYQPEDSFDPQGFLRSDIISSLTSEKVDPVSDAFFPPDTKRSKLIQEKQQEMEEVANCNLEEILNDITNNIIREVGQEAIVQETQSKIILEEVAAIGQEVADEVVKNACQLAMKEARNEELERRLLEETKLEASGDIVAELIEEAIEIEVQEISSMKMAEVNRQLKLLKFYKIGEEIIEDICQGVTKSLMMQVFKESKKEALIERENQIRGFIQKREMSLTRKAFTSWMKLAMKKRKTKEMLSNFPSVPGRLSLEDQNKIFGGRRKSTVDQKCTERAFKVIEVQDNLMMQMLKDPLHLQSLICDQLCAKSVSTNITWKCVLCFPNLDYIESENAYRAHSLLTEAILKKFSFVKSSSSVQNIVYRDRSFGICFRYVDDTIVKDLANCGKKRREYLQGTDAILFFHFDGVESFEKSRSRLSTLKEFCTSVPVHVCTTSPEVGEVCDLFAVNEISPLPLDIYHPDFLTNLFSSVTWLSSIDLDPVQESLMFQTLEHTVNQFIGENVNLTMYSNLHDRLQARLGHQAPEVLIELYNAAIEHLHQVIGRQELKSISWPSPELVQDIPYYWNEDSYVEVLLQRVRGLRLPSFDSDLLHNFQWSDQVLVVKTYLQKVSPLIETQHEFEIERILKRAKRKYSVNYRLYPASFFIPWTDIINCCINFKLSIMIKRDLFSPVDKEIIVGVFKEDMKNFKVPKLWKESIGYLSDQKEQKFWESRKQKATPMRDTSTLGQDFLNELNESYRFEQRLLKAMDSSYCMP